MAGGFYDQLRFGCFSKDSLDRLANLPFTELSSVRAFLPRLEGDDKSCSLNTIVVEGVKPTLSFLPGNALVSDKDCMQHASHC